VGETFGVVADPVRVANLVAVVHLGRHGNLAFRRCDVDADVITPSSALSRVHGSGELAVVRRLVNVRR
jgi:hypothetical protein